VAAGPPHRELLILRKALSSGFLLDHYPALLTARYWFATKGVDAFAVIEAIVRKCGCIPNGRGGKLDIGKAASILLIDCRNGALGRISLETPELRTARSTAKKTGKPKYPPWLSCR
jgi:ribosome biogenesis GTPase A